MQDAGVFEGTALKHLLSTSRAVWKREAGWCVVPGSGRLEVKHLNY